MHEAACQFLPLCAVPWWQLRRESSKNWKTHGNFMATVERNLGRFPFSQKSRSNRLKCKWNARFKWKFSGTNGRPSGVLHFFRSNLPLAQNFHFYCSRICSRLQQLLAPLQSANEIASFLPAWKKPFLLTQKISGISNQKFWLDGRRPCFFSSEGARRVSRRGGNFRARTCYLHGRLSERDETKTTTYSHRRWGALRPSNRKRNEPSHWTCAVWSESCLGRLQPSTGTDTPGRESTPWSEN